jgi:branched-chain amino acid transport system substrate-binding protein
VLLSTCGFSDAPISIGLTGSLSHEQGISMLRGASLAVSQLNAAGGVRGRRIQLVTMDDSGRAELATLVATEFSVNDSIVAVVGPSSSAALIAAAPVYGGGVAPLLHVSPTATSSEVPTLGQYTFRICADDRIHGRALADWAVQRLGAGSAAILYRNDAHGRTLGAAFQNAFTRRGGRVLSVDPFVPALPSVEPYFERVRVRGGADVLLLAAGADDATRILATMDSVGGLPALLSSGGLWSAESFAGVASAVFLSTHYLPDMPGPRNEDFVAAYRRAHGGEIPDQVGAGAYDIVHLLARAIEAAGVDRASVRDYVAGIGSRTDAFDGVTGQIAFDGRGDVVGRDVVIAVPQDGKLVAAGER